MVLHKVHDCELHVRSHDQALGNACLCIQKNQIMIARHDVWLGKGYKDVWL